MTPDPLHWLDDDADPDETEDWAWVAAFITVGLIASLVALALLPAKLVSDLIFKEPNQ